VRAIIALLLLGLMCLSFSESFERPWEDYSWVNANENILVLGTEIWWNLEVFYDSASSTNLKNITSNVEVSTDVSASRYLVSGQTFLSELEADKETCLDTPGIEDFLQEFVYVTFPLARLYEFVEAFTQVSACM